MATEDTPCEGCGDGLGLDAGHHVQDHWCDGKGGHWHWACRADVLKGELDAEFRQEVIHLAQEAGWNGVENSKILTEFIKHEFDLIRRWRYIARSGEAVVQEYADGDSDTLSDAIDALERALKGRESP